MLPLVITVEQPDGGQRRYAFADSPVSIGRSPFAELQLSEPFISRWEGTLRFDERELTYFSLGTTNSTLLDGQSLAVHEEDIPLSTTSVLQLGELTLRFAREPVPESDLRRKGKRKPTRDDPAVAVKTVFLDGADAWAAAAPTPPPTAAADVLQLSAAKTEAQIEPLSTLAAYREARAAAQREAQAQLAALPESERTPWLATLLRDEPVLVQDDAELRTECERRGLAAARGNDMPELRAWLQAIGRGVLPEHVQFDPQLTLGRVLGLLEALIQSLAEIHDAQDSVRKRWLGQSPRRSVLQSDKGQIVLAYLLNPQADWTERMRELEQSIRDAVTHELALFKATLEGARALVESVSPEAIEHAEAEEPSAEPAADSFWSRLLGSASLQKNARLWQRTVQTHAELQDGRRYERVFLGRFFARAYLAAMGQRGSSKPSNREPAPVGERTVASAP